jgi:hypothetical protein
LANDPTQEQIRARLERLKHELGVGQSELHALVAREAYLRETTLRITGAIEVLEELIVDGDASTVGNGQSRVSTASGDGES